MRILALIFCMHLLQSAGHAQSRYPIVEVSSLDSMTPGGERIAHFDFVNHSGKKVRPEKYVTTGICRIPDFSHDTLYPNDTMRVTVYVNTREYTGSYSIDAGVLLSDGEKVSQTFRYYKTKRASDTVTYPPCNCNKHYPEFQGGENNWADTLVQITLLSVTPATHGVCSAKVHINANGIADSLFFIESIDSVFEAALSKNIQRPGTWTPTCSRIPEPGYESCNGLKPVSCYLLVKIRY